MFKNATILVALFVTILLFQNCGAGLHDNSSQATGQSAGDNPWQAEIDQQVKDSADRFFPVPSDINIEKNRLWMLSYNEMEEVIAQEVETPRGQLAHELPAPAVQYGYDNQSEALRFAGNLVNDFFDAIEPVAKKLAEKVILECPTSMSQYLDCQEKQLKQKVASFWRVPTGYPELASLVELYQKQHSIASSRLEALQDVFMASLTSPYFLYRIESEVGSNDEIATRKAQNLAFAITRQPASPELIAAAQRGELERVEDRAKHVQKLMDTESFRNNLTEFFLEWLEVKTPEQLNQTAAIKALDQSGIGESFVEETVLYLSHFFRKTWISIDEIMKARFSFVSQKNNLVYSIDENFSNEFVRVNLNPEQRRGILTHPSVLASHVGDLDLNIIKRGEFYLTKMICQSVPIQPNADVSLSGDVQGSVRDRLEAHTTDPVCASCHQVMDPFGFANENFDKIGAWRTQDQGYPVDASADLDFFKPGLRTVGAVETIDAVSSSFEFKQCFVRQMFRYFYGRLEKTDDYELLNQAYLRFIANGGQIDVLFQDLMTSDRFSKREGGI